MGSVVAALIIGFVFLFVEKVPAGYVSVVYSISHGVEDDVLTQGWHIVSPTKKTSLYSVATEQLYMSKEKKEGSKEDEFFDVICNDGKMNVDFEMPYSFDAETVPSVYTRYRGMSGKDIVDSVVKGKIKSKISEVTSKYTVIEAHMENKAELNKEITEYLRDYLKDFGIVVESANFSRTSVDPSVEEAIVVRSRVSQELEIEKQRQEKAKLESETKKIEAEGEATKNTIEAQNAAEIIIIEAEAEATANRIRNDSLTDKVLQDKYMEKWNGQLPKVTSNGFDMMFNVSDIVD